jgi:hypothetical protein
MVPQPSELVVDEKPDELRETEPPSLRPVDWDAPRDSVCAWDTPLLCELVSEDDWPDDWEELAPDETVVVSCAGVATHPPDVTRCAGTVLEFWVW